MLKILKYFEKRQVIVCNYHMQETARIGPDITQPAIYRGEESYCQNVHTPIETLHIGNII